MRPSRWRVIPSSPRAAGARAERRRQRDHRVASAHRAAQPSRQLRSAWAHPWRAPWAAIWQRFRHATIAVRALLRQLSISSRDLHPTRAARRSAPQTARQASSSASGSRRQRSSAAKHDRGQGLSAPKHPSSAVRNSRWHSSRMRCAQAPYPTRASRRHCIPRGRPGCGAIVAAGGSTLRAGKTPTTSTRTSDSGPAKRRIEPLMARRTTTTPWSSRAIGSSPARPSSRAPGATGRPHSRPAQDRRCETDPRPR